MTNRLTIASNQGDIGGGEVMLMALANAARELGRDVTIVGPVQPSFLLDRARREGFTTIPIPGSSARRYLRNLRRWDATEREGLLWCNGLRPAFATAGRPDRVVHLHQRPRAPLTVLARAAAAGAVRVVAPSHYLADSLLPDAEVLWNWTEDIETRRPRIASGRLASDAHDDVPLTIGYLGRLSQGKGVPVLCEAVSQLIAGGHDVRLLLAGEARFINDDEAQAVEEAIAALGPVAQRGGWMDRDEFFSSVDLAVFPSTLPESFGLVAAEAMAARCPFVVTDVGALPEVVGADYPYLARPNDASDLARLIEEALHADWSAQLDASHERWANAFTHAAGRERLDALLRSIDTTRSAQ